ncbi:MAG: SDR family oxidoreductase, partial [Lachnospiraceae bacterium]|nr:SDR family oxidoreductase [Lachnospiraceae bacterium]
ILVNNAGVGYYGLHEELNAAKIKQMVRTNLELPLILSNLLLRDLKKSKGYLLQISSVTALKNSPHGCAYGATKAGLTAFSRSLFEEARKYGVKVTVIHPDMTQTNLYRNADFTAAEDLQASLCPEDVAGAVRSVLTARDGMVIPELTLSPQLHRISKKQPQ